MRIWIIPEYPESLMTGGLQVQAVETFRALRELPDLNVELFNWSEKRPLPDIVHFIGLPPHMCEIARLVKRAGCPYVVTKLMGGAPSPVTGRIAAMRARIGGAISRKASLMETLRDAAHVVAITEGDRDAVRMVFGTPGITVVPNGVADPFFSSTNEAWRLEHGNGDFTLCVGAIQPRKNQVLLVQACNLAGLAAVILGPVLPGCEAYADKLATVMLENARHGGRWLRSLTNDDALLPSAYAACRLFALMSTSETQPLSVMQAMAAKKPVLVKRAAYLEGSIFSGLESVDAGGIEETASALRNAWDRAEPTSLSRDYSWAGVALKLREIYHCVMERRSR